MLRVGARLLLEREMVIALRKDARRAFRAAHSSAARAAASTTADATPAAAPPAQTVLAAPRLQEVRGGGAAGGAQGGGAAPPPPPPPPGAPPPRRAWTAAAALAITASLGGVYYYRKALEPEQQVAAPNEAGEAGAEEGELAPTSGAAFPAHVEYLVAGGGTAGLAALRSLRALRPEARVLLAAAERAPPYMRPPLTKELWRSAPAAALAAAAAAPHTLTFTQWNGKRRNLVYEPLAFFTPVEELGRGGEGGDGAGRGGAALARGWRVSRLDAVARRAELSAPGHDPVTITFDKMLIATGSEPVVLPALAGVRGAGRGGPLHTARDAARLARALAGGARRVAVVGGGPRAAELAAALADQLGAGGEVVCVYRGERALRSLLPEYLAAHAERLLRERHVTLLPSTEVVDGWTRGGGVRLRVRTDGREDTLDVDYVVEALGARPDVGVWTAAGLEADARGVLVSAELAARAAIYAAGDAACWQRPHEPRGAARSHDHAVASGRRAGENMAAGEGGQQLYAHRPMNWADLGPELGYEYVGEVDSRLQTVGVFSSDAVTPAAASAAAAAAPAAPTLTVESSGVVPAVAAAGAEAGAAAGAEAGAAAAAAGGEAEALRYARGVVLYLREGRVVGVLLWNLFNRVPTARRVLEQGEFADLLEVGKLFAPHEE